MKKSSLLLLLVALSILSAKADGWDDFADVERMWDGQKTITNQQFEEVMDALQEGEKKQEEKKQKKKIKKISGGGTSLHNDLKPEGEIFENNSLKPSEDGFLVNLPVNAIVDNQPLEKGFYKVLGERSDDGKIYLSFYQSQFFKGKVLATETEDDYGEKEINFAKIVSYNDSFIKIIYGSLDFNAFAVIPYIEKDY